MKFSAATSSVSRRGLSVIDISLGIVVGVGLLVSAINGAYWLKTSAALSELRQSAIAIIDEVRLMARDRDSFADLADSGTALDLERLGIDPALRLRQPAQAYALAESGDLSQMVTLAFLEVPEHVCRRAMVDIDSFGPNIVAVKDECASGVLNITFGR